MKNSITQITEKFIKNIGEIFKEAVLLQAQRICLMQRQAGTLRQTIEKYRERTGHYPTRVLADKIYRNRDNLNFCKEHGIRLSGPALSRPKKDEPPDLKQNYIDECERVEVERRFSLAKRKCNLGMVTARLADTAFHCIAMSIVILNLRKLMLSLHDFLKRHFLYLRFFEFSFVQ